VREVAGTRAGQGCRVAVVAASFNDVIVRKLLDGTLSALRAHQVSEDDVTVAWVPGAFELPLLARRLASTGRYDAVVCLGAVVRGETPHFDYVAGEAARGVADAAAATGVPVMFGVLTTESMQQAMDRAGGLHGNKGWDSAIGALQMVNVLRQLDRP
jgi:6,7-dimethyl-8-ribityllumazine synthase